MDFTRRLRSGIFIGLLILCAGSLLIANASQTTVLTANADLSHYWRTTYDILVRPAGSRSPIEDKYGLVAANSLSGIRGGISFDQYQLIKSLPGVDTAAPIAMVGYINWMGATKGFPLPQTGAYLLETTFSANDGVTPVRQEERAYYFISPSDGFSVITKDGYPSIYINPPNEMMATLFQTGLLLAGIEPSQEAKLVGLDKAVINGEYLTDNMPLFPTSYLNAHPYCLSDYCPETEIALPILINDANLHRYGNAKYANPHCS